MRVAVFVLGGWLLLTAVPASAQILGTGVTPVMEIGTALYQQTITAVQSVLSVKNELLNLAPIGEMALAAEWAQDMADITAIITSAQDLTTDIQTLQRQIIQLFDLQNAPNSTTALAQRQQEIRRLVTAAYCYAIQVQSLVRTLIHTIDHLSTLTQQISSFLGAKQGAQVLTQVNSSLNQTLVTLTLQNAAFQRAESLEKSTEPLVIESLHRINAEMMADWPTRR